MIKRVRKCNLKVIIIFIIFSCFSSRAQTPEKTSLLTFLSTIEVTYDVRFSYATNELSDIKIIAPIAANSLREILDYIEQNTSLKFSQIDDRYITVILKTEGNERCGRIIDSLDNFPLEGATIIIGENKFSTTSNAEGIFFIPDDYLNEGILISYVGYETTPFQMTDLSFDCITIKMKLTITSLTQVTLQSLFTKGISKQLDGSFIINTHNFGLLPGQVEGDVLQIAQELPGVESVDETISNINIRGGTNDENNILWDDIKMYQSGHFFGLISAFNPDLTKKVTVYKNGANPRFGEGASGVIDMRSENDLVKSFTGGAGFNLINTHAFAEIPISESFGVQVSGRRSINDFLQSPVYSIYEDRIFQDTEITLIESNETSTKVTSENNFEFYDFSAKLLWNLSEESSFRANFLTINNALDFTETLTDTNNSETSNLDQKSIVGGISWAQTWNQKLKTSLLAYGTYYILNSVNEEIFTTQTLLQENEVLETGIKIDAAINISEKSNIQTGYHFSETGIANTQDVNLPRFRSFEKDVLRTHIAFANFQYSPNANKTSINVGLRANYFTKLNKLILEPRLAIHQALVNGFSVEILGEFKSQSTTQRIDFDNDFLGVEKRRWVLANNEEIPLILSKQVSLGLVYNKSNWFANIEGFYKYVDGITTSNQGFQNQFQYIRTNGSYTAKGLELVVNKKMKAFSTWITYMFMHNDYTFDELMPSNFPSNLEIHHTATLASSFVHKQFKLALGVNWHSGKPYTIPASNEAIITEDGTPIIQYASPNAEHLPDYFRINLSAEYFWDISQTFDAKFNFSILNVFDTKNTLNIRYGIKTDGNNEPRINQIEEVSLGFTPNFSFQLLF